MKQSIISPVSNLYNNLKRRVEVKALIPNEYTPGIPLLTVRNEQLVAIVPFLKYKITGVSDRTLVFPIKYVLEYTLPECQLVCFRDLALDERFTNMNFEKIVGFFRHDAIKDMCKEEYATLREQTLLEIDKLVNFLTDKEHSYSQRNADSLKNNLRTIIEPFLTKQYELLDSAFYNKYLKD